MNRALTFSLTALCISGMVALPVLAEETSANDASISNGRITDSSAPGSTDANLKNSDATASNTTTTAGGSDSKAAIADKTSVDSSTSSDSANSSAVNTDKKEIAANDPNAAPATDPKADPNAAKPGAKPASKGGNVGIPTRAAAFTAGVVVGTPIAILRRTHMEILQGEHDLIGDYDTWWKKALFVFPGALMSVPFGGVSGGLGGCMYSVKNAWAGSKDEPFGKSSFSLGDIGN